MTMYELTEDYIKILNACECGEIPAEAVDDMIEAAEGEIELKAEKCAVICAELRGECAKLKQEETRLAERRKSIESSIDTINRSVFKAMKTTGKLKFKTDLYSFSICKNPVALVVDKPEDIPQEYLIPQPPKADTTAIKNALKQGAKLDFAHLEQSEGLRVK